MPNVRMSVASAKMKAAKMKADAKKKAAKMKAKSPAKKTGSPKAGFKYEKIKSTSEYKPKMVKDDNKKLKAAKPKVKKAKKDSPAKMSGRSYDMKMAYDKKLTPKARLHYLENERHDKDSAMKMGSPYEKHGSPYHKHGSPYHMGHKDSPMNKALVGKQHNLPEHLKKKIEAAPEMKGSPYHMSNELKYGGPVIDQMKSLSQAGANKVLKHMKSKI